MKNRILLPLKLLTFALVSAISLHTANAGVIITSVSAPTTDGDDIFSAQNNGIRNNAQDFTDNGGAPGQSFTINTGGTLSSVTLKGGGNGSTGTGNGTFTLRIVSLPGPATTGNPVPVTNLYAETFTGSVASNTNFLTFNLTTPVVLSSAGTYGFDVFASSGFFGFAGSNNNAYTGGAAYNNNSSPRSNGATIRTYGYDRTFYTSFAAVPEPSTVVLLSLGMLGIVLRRRRAA